MTKEQNKNLQSNKESDNESDIFEEINQNNQLPLVKSLKIQVVLVEDPQNPGRFLQLLISARKNILLKAKVWT